MFYPGKKNKDITYLLIMKLFTYNNRKITIWELYLRHDRVLLKSVFISEGCFNKVNSEFRYYDFEKHSS